MQPPEGEDNEQALHAQQHVPDPTENLEPPNFLHHVSPYPNPIAKWLSPKETHAKLQKNQLFSKVDDQVILGITSQLDALARNVMQVANVVDGSGYQGELDEVNS
ncbi:hypothetical protein Ddye_018537 [Dipteronia dyeriana]|uniref:Uncharacterized protein n=1 Tax=Dipteronia dyeriana TaxID=168575 RepID=A0AAD9X1U2_9ROSI|nr:hypothetical protein Ddye_018537 [Dipteronia dyeriana]